MTCASADHVFVEGCCETCGVDYFDVPERVQSDDAIYNPELLP